MWKSLIWKEWHEQRWKLGFGCALLLTFTFVGLHTRVASDDAIVGLVTFFGAVLLPLLNAMGLVAAERDEGSFQTLMRLPVSPRLIYVVKTLMGAGVVAGPILASGVVALVIAGDREMSSLAMLTLIILSAAMGVVIFLWTSVAGMRQPTEARAAVAGVIVMGMWLLLIGLVTMVTGNDEHWLIYSSPLGWLGLSDASASRPLIALMQSVTMLALWLWGLHRFVRPLKTQ